MTIKGPTSTQMIDDFGKVRDWISELRTLQHYRIEMREVHHRVLGNNEVPVAVWIETLDDALAILGKAREVGCFASLVEHTRQRQPLLLDWLARKPLKALALAGVWNLLLDIVDWIKQHPRPGVFLRQIGIPGVHSKFIEALRGILVQWLDQLLPPAAVNRSASGVSGFASRYGFRDKPQRIRLRALDPAHALLPGAADADITLDAESFASLSLLRSPGFLSPRTRSITWRFHRYRTVC